MISFTKLVWYLLNHINRYESEFSSIMLVIFLDKSKNLWLKRALQFLYFDKILTGLKFFIGLLFDFLVFRFWIFEKSPLLVKLAKFYPRENKSRENWTIFEKNYLGKIDLLKVHQHWGIICVRYQWFSFYTSKNDRNRILGENYDETLTKVDDQPEPEINDMYVVSF